jgi:hypothetical protein
MATEIWQTSSPFYQRATSGWRGCDLTRKINSLHPILLQLEADQTPVDFTRGRYLSAISKPSLKINSLQLTEDKLSSALFVNHNDSWLLKISLGEDNYSSTLKPTPIRLESGQLSRVIGTRTLDSELL